MNESSSTGSTISGDSSSSEFLRVNFNPSVSRSSSGRSTTETRDILMLSFGEPAEFLPFKVIAPEILMDVHDELRPIFEEYQKEMVCILGKI